MEYQFENVRVYDPKYALEFQYRYGARKILFWGVVYVIMMIIYLFLALGDPVFWIMVIVSAGLVVYQFSLPYRLIKKHTKKSLKYYDGKLPTTYTRFGDKIVVEDIDSVKTIEYHKIDKVTALKHGYYLHYGQTAALAIDPKGFTKGTFTEFKQFLRTKRPDLKIPE